MADTICLATSNGVVFAQRAGDDWRETSRALAGRRVTSAAAVGDSILAGSRDGILRSEDRGQTWHDSSAGLSIRYVRWLAAQRGKRRAFAGTEPAAIFVSEDEGQHWRECPEVGRLRDRHGWLLPYSSGAGCVRGFAFHDSRGYAAVEVGGALVTDDDGENWRLVGGSDGSPDLGGPPEARLYPDVHSILVHPSSADLVFAPTGGGFYRSRDAGKTWALLYDCYCRAAWVDPADADHILLGPADGVDHNGRIEVSRDGGQTWRDASDGLKVPWARHMVERFVAAGGRWLAGLSNGQLLSAPSPTGKWRRTLPEVRGVNAVVEVGG